MDGLIYWIIGDIKHIKGDYKTTVQITQINDVIIDKSFIKFDWLPTSNFYGGFLHVRNEHDNSYKGIARVTDSEPNITVECTIFSNSDGYLLKGNWKEDTNYYTWFAEVKR